MDKFDSYKDTISQPDSVIDFLSGLLTAFEHATTENFNQVLKIELCKIRDFLKLDQVLLLHIDQALKGNLLYSTDEVTPRFVDQKYQATGKDFPWLVNQFYKGNLVRISSLDQLPPEASTDSEVLRKAGLEALLVIPYVSAQDSRYGIFSYSSSERIWDDILVRNLKFFCRQLIFLMEKNQLLKVIQDSERKFRTVADCTVDLERWRLPDGNLAYISSSCERITGYSREEFMNQPMLMEKIIHPEDLEGWNNYNSKINESKILPELEFRIIHKNGQVRWLDILGQQVIDDSGRYIGLRTSSRDITDRKITEDRLREALNEIENLKQELESENVILKEKIGSEKKILGIITRDQAMIKILDNVKQVASTDSPVLLTGETGTGKELIANAIHNMSSRRNRLLITVNCAAIPPSLIESELFGRERGAFTGAIAKQVGRFEMADKSTLFLDEVAELPPEVQSKLLRVLQFGEFQLLGSPATRRVNVRIIAATNRNLSKAIEEGTFRRDLYYRLNVFPVHVPPLRERKTDIPGLVWNFVEEFSETMGKRIDSISKRSMDRLMEYSWPGNIRELRNIIEYSMILSDREILNIHIHDESLSEESATESLAESERRYILKVLDQTGWRIRGKGGAAELLGLNESTLRFRMKKLGIRRN